ncbi:UDP-N-acetylmuramoyl-L-alanine--D-glutamate ligase [Algibacillus agarilyticus]|uniref:UDP-N-acetylmuramoyl-L-alanine--D-glutamate ligase n=1 Tax=Algibacillus agarilyticus TaxID=2234133 RepID=UPI000DCFE0CA|nr:UDP-N-acetylmuramoyl-L-alanine--D-glutamate ligase [Algibacillus agarilyticus]
MTWLKRNNHKKFCVLGLGLSGLSCVRYLLSQGIVPAVCDTRKQPPLVDQLDLIPERLALKFGFVDSEYLQQFDYILMSPGIDPRQSWIEDAQAEGVELINEIELFSHAIEHIQENRTPVKVIAVTGSNGKSTVVSLLGETLLAAGISNAVGGNIGRPALDLLNDNPDVYVLELSSFQLEFCPSFSPDIALLLNVSEDHMDRYSSMEEYTATKKNIYRGAQLAIFNADDDLTQPNECYRQVSFGQSKNAKWQVIDDRACYLNQPVYSLQNAGLVGVHNQLNMLAVAAVMFEFSAIAEKVEHAFQHYTGLAHRCQRISQRFGVNWLNDSKATNVGATLAALNGLANEQGQLILIAGGVGKDADFEPLRSVLNEQVSQLITFGQEGHLIASLKASSTQVDDLEGAVKLAASLANNGDTVLLSPACASLDMFKNFEQRGLAFIQAVEALDEFS